MQVAWRLVQPQFGIDVPVSVMVFLFVGLFVFFIAWLCQWLWRACQLATFGVLCFFQCYLRAARHLVQLTFGINGQVSLVVYCVLRC